MDMPSAGPADSAPPPGPLRGEPWLKASALDALPQAVLLTDADERIVYVNAAFEALSGFTADDVRGAEPRMLQGPETAETARRALREAIDAREPVQVQLVNYRADGTPYWAELWVAPVASARADADPALHFVGTAQDVTARVELERALRESVASHRLLAEHCTDIISRHDPEGRYRFASHAAEELLGWAPEALVGRSMFEAIHPDDLAAVQASHEALRSPSAPVGVEYRIRRQDGSYLWVETTSRAVRDDDGAVVEIIAVTRDISERKEAEQQRREAEQRWQRLVEGCPIPLLVHQGGQVAYANEALLAAAGVPSVDLIVGARLDAFVAPEDRERLTARIEREAAATPAPEVFRLRLFDGETRYVEVHSARMVLDGEPAVQALLLDVTARETERATLEAARRDAEASASARQRAFASLTHELRTPLTAIIGFAELLREEADPAQHGMADVIAQSGQRLLNTINSVLEGAAGAAHARRADPTDVGAALTSVGRMLQLRAEEKGLHLEIDVPKQPLMARADADALERVLVNLISNALKYTPRGDVWVRASRHEDRIRIEVADTGIGISEAFLPRLFEAFERAPEAAAQADGTGLGLPITRQLIESMGGSLSVRSAEGAGSTFTVDLPAAPPSP